MWLGTDTTPKKVDMKIVLTFTVLLLLTIGCEKPVDRFATVDGKKVHILDRGTGEPTVVFLTGLICPLEHFYTVQSQISKETRTFSYDRSGLGLSEIIDTVRTYDHVANELEKILTSEGIKAPYVLVAHSYGGGLARQYYKQFPDKVAGFVFVDCANDEIFLDSLVQKRIISLDSFGPDSIATKGEAYEMNYERENIYWFKEDFKTELPVHLLVAAGERAGSEEMIKTKVNTYRHFDKQAPQMKIIYTEHSGHHIQRDQPELVVKSIKEIIDEVRQQSYR
jgi:pimeloyl-ACP methyl ester carboxylesterase